MFKTTLKSVAIALSVLAAIVLILSAVDVTRTVSANGKELSLKVTVVDLDGVPVHNAVVKVNDQTFFTDNKGNSPNFALLNVSNCYDASITEWGTVTVAVTKDGFVPAFVFNCVVYSDVPRKLTVKIYPADGSDLPYVCYVESPPDDYMRQIMQEP